MIRFISILVLSTSLRLSAQTSDSFEISSEELKSFLNDMYNHDRLMKKIKFDNCVDPSLPEKFVKEADDKFHVFNDKDWPVILRQIERAREMAIDKSYISRAKFVEEPMDIMEIYTEISFPLFNKAKDVCILRVSIIAGCSSHDIHIYRKNGTKWEVYTSLYL